MLEQKEKEDNMIYAVIDTNVFLSGMITNNKESPTVKVLEAVMQKVIIVSYHSEIIEEYNDVFHRVKFSLNEPVIQNLLNVITTFGQEIFPKPTGEIFIDKDDLIFYEVAMEKRDEDAYLVTGNQKHYPIRDFIVTPTEMMKILQKEKNENSFLES